MDEQKLLKRKHKALRDGNKLLLASTYADLGGLYINEAEYEKAVEQYSDLADVYKQLGKNLDYARANRMIGEAYMHLDQFERALKYQQIFLSIARKENDKLEEQRALATIGHTYLTSYLYDTEKNRKELEFAYKFLMKSLVICESLTNISKHEHMDMSARLFANLGVVQECQGNYDEGIKLVEKSIKICKAHDLYDQLERSHTQLGSLYYHQNEYDKAISQYNLAIEVAGCLPDKTSRLVASLLFKAEVLIALSDFRGAKQVLVKAHKMKSPNVIDRETVTRNLKIVVVMYNTEDTLLVTSETDYETRKELYEKMGDGACALKAYTLGIEYYQKMLEAAIKAGDTGEALSPCYVSLAQTYKDNKQYDLALKYFEKEFNLYKNEAEEAVTTLLNIASTMELAGKDWIQIESTYRKAYDLCKSEKEQSLKIKVLSRHIGMLKKHNKISEAQHLEKELMTLNYIESGSDSESGDSQTTPNIGEDICLLDITDISDTSDNEGNSDKPRSARNKTNSYVVKKNNKGETQLHTACIGGKTELVKKLIQQKHPINIRDNCGWLPIHEASLHGHLDIVELLVDNGASINDRGGTGCSGITPLHDAAINGHLQIVEFLLNRGASSISKDDKGDTPLALLKQWRKSETLDSSTQSFYETLVERMTKDLEKSGRPEKVQKTSKSLSVYESSPSPENPSNDNKTSKSRLVGRLRDNSRYNDDLFLDMPSTSRVRNETHDFDSNSMDATEEYRQTMKSLRHRSSDISKKRKSNEDVKISSHVSVEDINDENWLEDDLRSSCNKKRKTVLTDSVFNTLGTRKTDSYGKKNSSPSLESLPEGNSKNISKKNHDLDGLVTDDDMDDYIRTFQEDSSDSSSIESFKMLQKKSQTSLTSAGFSLLKERNPHSKNNTNNFLNSQKKKHQLKLTDLSVEKYVVEADSTTDSTSCNNSFGTFAKTVPQILHDPVLSVDVRIDGKLYRVPILFSEVNKKTVKWLAEEAAKRYARKEFVRPLLDLETKNGAVLAEDDFVSILFPAGSVQSEEVQARIVKWDIPSLVERYKESCNSLQSDVDEEVLETLQISSTALKISNLELREQQLVPLFKAINHQSNLNVLDLSGIGISKESMSNLCHSLPSLVNLTDLNLSYCNIEVDQLKIFADLFLSNDQQSILENLVALDLSFNPLTDASLKHLAVLSTFLKLEIFNLTKVEFSPAIFDSISNRNLELSLKQVKEFDISYNGLKTEQIGRILTWLDPGVVESLNVSNNYPFSSRIVREIVGFLKKCTNGILKLKKLSISGCNATNEEIEELLGEFDYSGGLESIDLSYNPQLTIQSLKSLFRHCSLTNLDLKGCDQIFVDVEENNEVFNILNESLINNLSVTFHESVSCNGCKSIQDVWENKYSENGKVVLSRNFLKATVTKV